MLYILSSILILSTFLLHYQYFNIRNNYIAILNTTKYPYIQHNITSNNITNDMLHKITLAHTIWTCLWLPITITNIILSSFTIILTIYDYTNINLLYTISILTASSLTPILTNPQFIWFEYYNNVITYHSLKFNLILVNNILINNKNILTNNKLNNNELLFIQQYTNKLINTSNNLTTEIDKYYKLIQ